MILAASMLVTSLSAQAFTVKGVVIDRSTKEPLIGATVQVSGTTVGAITDMDGRFELNRIEGGSCTLVVQYVSYRTEQIQVQKGQSQELVIALAPDDQQLDEVTVVAKKNLENERALMMERQKSSVAIENIGAKEMSAKGISNVEEGVKKITGVSIASAGQIIVRGLGDRYSTTTLNGLPIASPNPDNKLIPLDLFPTSTVKNITVSKVYEANAFADYSGAHIDIGTKEQTGEDFFSVSFNTGGKFNTLGNMKELCLRLLRWIAVCGIWSWPILRIMLRRIRCLIPVLMFPENMHCRSLVEMSVSVRILIWEVVS